MYINTVSLYGVCTCTCIFLDLLLCVVCSGHLIGSLSFLEASVITSFTTTTIILRGSVCLSLSLCVSFFYSHICVEGSHPGLIYDVSL